MHRSTRQVVDDLQAGGRLIEIEEPISPQLEMAEIQRRVYANGGPALLFSNPANSPFPMACNLFGSLDQARYLFRHTLEGVRRAIELKIDPTTFWKNPWRYRSAPWVGLRMLPRSCRSGPVLRHSTTLSQLPHLVSWPRDGGPFVTLPQVLSQSPLHPGLKHINLGMYRIQLAGNDYEQDREVGLHYQIHRGIGVHHRQAVEANRPFSVNCSVGGSPAMTLAAVMPLPEGMSELTFAGALAGHRIPMIQRPGLAPIYADADFCLVGEVDPFATKSEGPFGDHLGYYSLQHPFPVLRIKQVYHRPNAIWPFTVVGRPPQEDTTFGELIHELTGPIVPTVLPGVKGVHAVDASGVHPLLLAIGSERYDPYRRGTRPQELLTQANAILGQGQMSLAKYLLILDQASHPTGDLHDIGLFFTQFLQRVDWSRDLHFQTKTTIDTLDYSGEGLNQGSKVVMAATGQPRRQLATDLSRLPPLPVGFDQPRLCHPGMLVLEWKGTTTQSQSPESVSALAKRLATIPSNVWHDSGIAWITLVDDSHFTSLRENNWLWVLFTRSNPALDIDGIESFTEAKHWGCRGPLLLDARCKPHHAPGLVEDPVVTKKIDAMASRGGPLARYL